MLHNNPRATLPLHELGARRRELTKPKRASHMVSEPRPLRFRKIKEARSVENLRCDLIKMCTCKY